MAASASGRFLLEMNDMAKEYFEYRNGGYWIAGTRVSLDSVVYAFLDGLLPARPNAIVRGPGQAPAVLAGRSASDRRDRL
jgi:hypothetical protein